MQVSSLYLSVCRFHIDFLGFNRHFVKKKKKKNKEKNKKPKKPPEIQFEFGANFPHPGPPALTNSFRLLLFYLFIFFNISYLLINLVSDAQLLLSVVDLGLSL